ADAKIGLARSGYYPDVSASASYSRIGPVPSLTFPGLGTFQFYPADNYSATVNYRQNILDFGKTAKSISLENQNKAIAQQSLVQVKQKISILAINCFYTLLYLQDAISIKDEEIQNLQEHLKFIQKKEASGSATQFEILTTQVKISAVENQKTDLKTAQKVQSALMNSLLGQPNDASLTVKNELQSVSTVIPADSLVSFAFRNRDELKIESEKETLAKLKYETVKSQNNPDLSIFASAGGKNGYIPNLNTIKANYVAGISLNVPIFDANRKKYNLLHVKSSMQSLDFETETMRRSITNEVVESEANLSASQQKIDEFELQLAHAGKAFSLAQINYKEGTITNLD
ncbi:MAG: TolC family protein, partial [Bacteroidota bacterium]|nr:TolC family protein [Bacteroidota bacterium]